MLTQCPLLMTQASDLISPASKEQPRFTCFDYEEVDRRLQNHLEGTPAELEERARKIALAIWREVFLYVSEPLTGTTHAGPERQAQAVASRVLATLRLFMPEDEPSLGSSYTEAAGRIGGTKQAHFRALKRARRHFGVLKDGSISLPNR